MQWKYFNELLIFSSLDSEKFYNRRNVRHPHVPNIDMSKFIHISYQTYFLTVTCLSIWRYCVDSPLLALLPNSRLGRSRLWPGHKALLRAQHTTSLGSVFHLLCGLMRAYMCVYFSCITHLYNFFKCPEIEDARSVSFWHPESDSRLKYSRKSGGGSELLWFRFVSLQSYTLHRTNK